MNLILSYVLHINKEELLIFDKKSFSYFEIYKINSILNNRIRFMPLEYLIQKKEFYNLTFYVNRNVLIPRPSTEVIIDYIINDIKSDTFNLNKLDFLDIGGGSGNISLSIYSELKYLNIILNMYSIDIDDFALYVMLKNCFLNFLQRKKKKNLNTFFMRLKKSNMFSIFNKNIKIKFDYIISNPPYLKKEEIGKELIYEPYHALYGKDMDGLFFYKKIANDAFNFMKNRSKIILEIPKNRDKQIIDIFLKKGYFLETKLKDLYSIYRVVVFKIKDVSK